MRILALSVGFLLFFYVNVWATYEYTSEHKEAYELIVSMQFNEAEKLIENIKNRDPEDVLIYHIENYIDFIGLFVSEEKWMFKAREKNKEERLEKLKAGDPESPYYFFSQAEVHLQWALARTRFKEYFTAAREVNKAIGMLEENEKRFPGFVLNKKSLSILHAIVGTLPDKYKGVISLVSNFSGTIDQGLSEINEVLAKSGEDYIFEREVIAIKAMIMLHLQNRKIEAWDYLSSSIIKEDDNPMSVFLLASTAMKCDLNEEAIKILQKRTRSPRFFPFYYLDLMLGSAKLSRLDKDADIYIKSYVDNFKGQDYYKDAYRKLAWHAVAVKKDENLYLNYMLSCLAVGNTNVDEDKSAYKEAKLKTPPHAALLKARLLFDGAYFSEASKALSDINENALSRDEEIEYLYRKARVFQKLGKTEDAILHFSRCLNFSEESRLYYCCNSALQLGYMYEQAGEYSTAIRFFKTCLSLNPSEYKNSLHQKAKAGLKRLGA